MINDERARERIGAPPPSRALTGRGTRGPSAIWEPLSELHQSEPVAGSFSGPFLSPLPGPLLGILGAI
ncbi:hypothetical protein QQF64_002812 [Cirrhinus molitorella]|uniref:Uncharacterized protein n=1 Tax=Cirrhinus molitorella TaxID=172907 RepID=A0ABR3MR72_9TELE